MQKLEQDTIEAQCYIYLNQCLCSFTSVTSGYIIATITFPFVPLLRLSLIQSKSGVSLQLLWVTELCNNQPADVTTCDVVVHCTLSQGFSTEVPRNPRVPRDIARGSARDRHWKNKHRFLNLLAKINISTEKYHSLLKRALTIIGLLYIQLTDHANVPWAVDIIIFMQGFPETWKLFQMFL
jgi:hypothetical protein